MRVQGWRGGCDSPAARDTARLGRRRDRRRYGGRNTPVEHAVKRWRRHSAVYAVVGTVLLLLDVRPGGPWTPDVLLLLGWAVVLLLHYRWAREYGDVHVREQQIRTEWCAGRSKEELVPK